MERLTYRVSIGGAEDAVLVDKKSTEECLEWKNVLKRLAYYEDLEEQGLLLKLPCKVGDTVYAIEAAEEEFEHFHCGLKVSKCDFDFWMIPLFGKCVFLTQAEAEETLKGMEEKKK